jgi:hypothetical protein
VLEQQRFAAVGRFHLAVGPFSDEEIGVDRDSDTFQFAGFFKSIQELSKRAISHLLDR